MNKNKKNILLIGLIVIFFIVGFIGFKGALPENKNHRVYTILQEYFPYTLEKRTGGLAIIYKDGSTRDIAKASDMLNISLLSRKVKKYYICYLRSENDGH